MQPKRYYDLPIPDHKIIRFDLLEALRDLLGDPILIYRDFLYDLVSASKGIDDVDKKLGIAYRTFPDVRTYINDLSLFGDLYTPIREQFIEGCEQKINLYRIALNEKYNTTGIKILPESHLYYYIAPRVTVTTSERGCKEIC